MTWTHFMDMHSGGGRKLAWEHIWIEAPKNEAKAIFYNRFGRNPERVTCTCCGEDYSVSEAETLEHATAYERGLAWVEDARGHSFGANRPADFKEGFYLEPDGEVPEGMRQGNWRRGPGITLAVFLASTKHLVVRTADIKPDERTGRVPTEGYIWAGDDA